MKNFILKSALLLTVLFVSSCASDLDEFQPELNTKKEKTNTEGQTSTDSLP